MSRIPRARTTHGYPNSSSQGDQFMLTKKLWATGLSAALIAMMGAPSGAAPG